MPRGRLREQVFSGGVRKKLLASVKGTLVYNGFYGNLTTTEQINRICSKENLLTVYIKLARKPLCAKVLQDFTESGSDHSALL